MVAFTSKKIPTKNQAQIKVINKSKAILSTDLNSSI